MPERPKKPGKIEPKGGKKELDAIIEEQLGIADDNGGRFGELPRDEQAGREEDRSPFADNHREVPVVEVEDDGLFDELLFDLSDEPLEEGEGFGEGTAEGSIWGDDFELDSHGQVIPVDEKEALLLEEVDDTVSESDQAFNILDDDTDEVEGSQPKIQVEETGYIHNERAAEERRTRREADMDAFVFDEGYDGTGSPYDRVVSASKRSNSIPDGYDLSLSGSNPDELLARTEDPSAPFPWDTTAELPEPPQPPIQTPSPVAPVDRRGVTTESASEALTEPTTEKGAIPRAEAIRNADEIPTEQVDRQVGWKESPEGALEEVREKVELARTGSAAAEGRLAERYGDGRTEKPSRSSRMRRWMAAGLAALTLVAAGVGTYLNRDTGPQSNDIEDLQPDTPDDVALPDQEDAARLDTPLFPEQPISAEPTEAELIAENPDLFTLDGFFDLDEEKPVVPVEQSVADTGIELSPSGEDAEFDAWLAEAMPELVVDSTDLKEPGQFDDWRDPAEFMHDEEKVMAQPWYEDDRYVVNNAQGFSQVMLEQRPDASMKDVRDTLKKYDLYYKGVNTRGKDQLHVLWGEDNSLTVYVDGVDVTDNLDKYTYDIDTDSYAEADTVVIEKDGVGDLDEDFLDWFENFDPANPDNNSI